MVNPDHGVWPNWHQFCNYPNARRTNKNITIRWNLGIANMKDRWTQICQNCHRGRDTLRNSEQFEEQFVEVRLRTKEDRLRAKEDFNTQQLDPRRHIRAAAEDINTILHRLIGAWAQHTCPRRHIRAAACDVPTVSHG